MTKTTKKPRRVTLKFLAEKAGVSPMVVSSVVRKDFSKIRVSEEKRKRIEGLIDEYQYTPDATAKHLVQQKTYIINLFIPSMKFFRISMQQQLCIGIQEHLQAAGYHISLCAYNADRLPDSFAADGGIFFYYGEPNRDVLARLNTLPFPVMAFGRCGLDDVHCVYRDNYAAYYALAQRLVEAGHRRIHLYDDHMGDVYNADGVQGFKDGLAAYDHVVLHHQHIPMLGAPNLMEPIPVYQGRKVAQALMDADMPCSAAVFSTDHTAVGCMLELGAKGVAVPDDISIVGNGQDTFTRDICPDLTRIYTDPADVGQRCAEHILALLSSEDQEGTLLDKIPLHFHAGETLKPVTDEAS